MSKSTFSMREGLLYVDIGATEVASYKKERIRVLITRFEHQMMMARGITKLKEPIHLDGTTLEGGGQLLRLSLSLSSLVHEPIRITDIRGKRGPVSSPGKNGGIKPAHYAGAFWLARATEAVTEGLEVKSRCLTFRPSLISAEKDALQAKLEKTETTSSNRSYDQVWRDVCDGGRIIRRESSISMSSPGSIFLILQAILPYVLFASNPTQQQQDGNVVPIRLSIQGGTNVWHSLSYEYAEQVLFPMLYAKLGIGPITMTLHHRGWSTGGASVGRVTFDITPLHPGRELPAFSYTNRGELSRLLVSILAPDAVFRKKVKDCVVGKLRRHFPDIEITFPVEESSGHQNRLYLLVVAETSKGYRLGRDWLFDRKINRERPHKTVEELTETVILNIKAELAHGGCIDEFLQDQLVVFQALAKGTSTIDGSAPSLHTQTARWVVERLLGTTFDDNSSCEGIGFVAGQKW